MQVLVLSINGEINTSLQIGDIAYYSSTGTVPNSGFATVGSTNPTLNTGTIQLIGVVTDINFATQQVTVMFDETLGVLAPTVDDYIMFAKNKVVNSSSLIGYYADVEFKNYSTDKIELYSVNSEFSQSSK
jgi:hypothetical protein